MIVVAASARATMAVGFMDAILVASRHHHGGRCGSAQCRRHNVFRRKSVPGGLPVRRRKRVDASTDWWRAEGRRVMRSGLRKAENDRERREALADGTAAAQGPQGADHR